MTLSEVARPLDQLAAAGTSAWLDALERDLITSGALRRLVDEDGVRGVTSNPAIFEQAILGSTAYDEQIRRLAAAGADPREIYRAIAFEDVRAACDVLRPVHERTGGVDGYVSLEVDPELADDAQATIEQARAYREAVDRPNLMIKIPGTEAGVAAIEQATREGMNVNVTLLFDVEAYDAAARAFVRGLTRRMERREDVTQVHSVASFFVSRVDTEVDRRLEELGRPGLRGLAGLANARHAYRRFRSIFTSAEFAPLRAAGAHVQRPLWASTGVKDPAYPPTLYVDGLVGPATVNTMPMGTLAAVGPEAVAGGRTVLLDPTPDLAMLRNAGIDLGDVTRKLLAEGIAKFVEPMERLLAGIREKSGAAEG